MQILHVFAIIEAYLRREKLDGLYNQAGDCGCLVDDLSPCGEMSEACQAGNRVECDCEDHDFHVVAPG